MEHSLEGFVIKEVMIVPNTNYMLFLSFYFNFSGYFLQVDIKNRSATADLMNYTPNGEWTLIDKVSLFRHEKNYPNIPEPFPEIVVTFHIRRKTLYYM